MISPLLEADVRAKCKVLGGPTAYEPFFEKLGVVFSNGQLLSECKPSWTEAMRELAGTPAPLPYLTDEEARSYACGVGIAAPIPESLPDAPALATTGSSTGPTTDDAVALDRVPPPVLAPDAPSPHAPSPHAPSPHAPSPHTPSPHTPSPHTPSNGIVRDDNTSQAPHVPYALVAVLPAFPKESLETMEPSKDDSVKLMSVAAPPAHAPVGWNDERLPLGEATSTMCVKSNVEAAAQPSMAAACSRLGHLCGVTCEASASFGMLAACVAAALWCLSESPILDVVPM